ncbi:ribonuclease HII [Synergistales bacterium]|nr:ribonuclease HII [Synergistales bacterium]
MTRDETIKFIENFDGPFAGTDEAGRGPLAGPVVAAAVILSREQERELLGLGLRDSKKMTPLRREAVFAAMESMGVLWSAQSASVERIAKTNILASSLWAMTKAVEKLPVHIDIVVVDGLFALSELRGRSSVCSVPLVKADSVIPAVSAASVVAKVLRDRAMRALDSLYPQYGLARHKGYPTKQHREAVRKFGLSSIHRALFCRKLFISNF